MASLPRPDWSAQVPIGSLSEAVIWSALSHSFKPVIVSGVAVSKSVPEATIWRPLVFGSPVTILEGCPVVPAGEFRTLSGPWVALPMARETSCQ